MNEVGGLGMQSKARRPRASCILSFASQGGLCLRGPKTAQGWFMAAHRVVYQSRVRGGVEMWSGVGQGCVQWGAGDSETAFVKIAEQRVDTARSSRPFRMGPPYLKPRPLFSW